MAKATELDVALDNEYLAACERKGKLTASSDSIYFDGNTEKKIKVTSKAKGTTVERVIKPPKGSYASKEAILAIAKPFFEKEADVPPEAIGAIAVRGIGYVLDGQPSMITKEGTLLSQPTVGKAWPLAGTVEDENLNLVTNTALYEAILEATNGGIVTTENNWCRDILSPKVAAMADKAQEMLAFCREQVKLLPFVEVEAVSPRWLRYFSDGSMATQSDALREAPRAAGRFAPLIYEGPAWALSLKLYGNHLSGRVFVNSEGDFIASDWCMRTTPDSKAHGIDLYTGKSSKHTLLSWCAGPGVQWMPAEQQREGGLQRAKLKSMFKFEDTMEANMTLLRIAAYLEDETQHQTLVKAGSKAVVVGATLSKKAPATPKARLRVLSPYKPGTRLEIIVGDMSWVKGVTDMPKLTLSQTSEQVNVMAASAEGMLSLPADLAEAFHKYSDMWMES